MTQYTELQLDALRELANIGSGTASTALSRMLGRSIDISVPNAQALPFADAVDATGEAESEMTGIVLGIQGDMGGTVLLLISPSDADVMCRLLGLEPGDELAVSALGEIGNIIGASYINALGSMVIIRPNMLYPPFNNPKAREALLYLNDQNKWPLQLVLRQFVVEGDKLSIVGLEDMGKYTDASQIDLRAFKAGMIILTIAPILLIYPLILKYFTKGTMTGAVKG